METETVTVALKDVDAEFVRRAKAVAVLHGLTLKQFVLDAVAAQIPKDPRLDDLIRAARKGGKR